MGKLTERLEKENNQINREGKKISGVLPMPWAPPISEYLKAPPRGIDFLLSSDLNKNQIGVHLPNQHGTNADGTSKSSSKRMTPSQLHNNEPIQLRDGANFLYTFLLKKNLKSSGIVSLRISSA